MQRFTCQLEKNIGIKADHIVGGCKGMYSIQVITGDGIVKHEYHQECKKCNRFIYRKFYRVSAVILCAVFFLFYSLVFGTPQGAIRSRLFIRYGIDSAITSEIDKVNPDEKDKESYIVYTEYGKEIWNVERLHLVCFAYPDKS